MSKLVHLFMLLLMIPVTAGLQCVGDADGLIEFGGTSGAYPYGDAVTCIAQCEVPGDVISGVEVNYKLSKHISVSMQSATPRRSSECLPVDVMRYKGTGSVAYTETFLDGMQVTFESTGATEGDYFSFRMDCLPNRCAAVDCENCGVHVNTEDGCTCDCPPSFYGVRCELEEEQSKETSDKETSFMETASFSRARPWL